MQLNGLLVTKHIARIICRLHLLKPRVVISVVRVAKVDDVTVAIVPVRVVAR